MVLNKIGHLARTSFGKTLTHVPQTVVAGTQSSYTSAGTPFAFNSHAAGKFGKPGHAHLHTSFQNPSSPASAKSKAAPGSSNGEEKDGGLTAYYDAWQKQHQPGAEEKEWKQFQFTKRIGWKAPTAAVLAGRAKEIEELGLRSETRLDQGALNRALTESAVQDLKCSGNEAEALARVNEAIAAEIIHIKEDAALGDAKAEGITAPSAPDEVASANSQKASAVDAQSPARSTTSITTPEHSTFSSLIGDGTAATSQDGLERDAYSEQVARLSDEKRFAEIPPVFEAMLANGIPPTIKAYNGLLSAVVHLPIAPHQVVPRALSVYTDLLRRKVVPDTTFYAGLIRLLSTHALNTLALKQALDQQRIRYGDKEGRFLFASQGTEYDIAQEDDSLVNAIRIFDSSIHTDLDRTYSSEMYSSLIEACARYGKVDEMIRIVSHMDTRGVAPYAAIYPHMIDAFAAQGDLASVVECYNGYKALAILDNYGKPAIKERNDRDVYAAVVRAYSSCNRQEHGQNFYNKIRSTYEDSVDSHQELRDALRDSISVDAVVPGHIKQGDFAQAMRVINEEQLTTRARDQALLRICVAAADGVTALSADKMDNRDSIDIAVKAFDSIDATSTSKFAAAVPMLALHVRKGEVAQAQQVWSLLVNAPQLDSSFAEATAHYATALIDHGFLDDALVQSRKSFTSVRSTAVATNKVHEAVEKIDEAIEHIGSYMARRGVIPSPQASMSFLRAMIENRGLVSPITEQLIAGLGPQDVLSLSLDDLYLALQVESDILSQGNAALDVAHVERFAHLLDTVVVTGTPPPKNISEIVDRAARKVSSHRPELATRWQNYQNSFAKPVYAPVAYPPQPITHVVPPTFADSYDPYAATTDFRGSNIIAEELDSFRTDSATALNNALIRFRNMRRAGRHPRYITYSKLITAAAKEGRTNLIHDILGMARDDLPFLAGNSMVRHGWSSILDAVVGACLTLGNRDLAARFHEELLEIGSAPTANTFGLYITTLKDSTRTFDEASEAVKIFQRAFSEGVEPSSFLYNALIGKLGKARRIDDCMFYFSEMRARGIRPTSVTYGTIVNACCRVSDQVFAEQLFDEMESMPNYKPRPAPYNSLMQFFLTTKRDSAKVLGYYERMRSLNIEPTMHTYKLLIDTYATLEPINLTAAEGVLETIRTSGQKPEAIHYASLIHAKGCTLHDMNGARRTFDEVLAKGEIRPQACLYQALFESMVANHTVADTEPLLQSMAANGVAMTPYIANTLIHGWATENNIGKSKAIYELVGMQKREPSTYEAMTRAYLTAENREGAVSVVNEMKGRGYPAAVSNKVQDLLGAGMA
ncbi:MAG: hypothetical protein Q9195_006131 [Heterodermia aff. obscurata]